MCSIQAIFFDLDNCLAPADELGEALFTPAFGAMAAANHGTLSQAQLEAAFADCWRHPLDWVARRHGFSDEMLAAGWRAFEHLEVDQPMHGYGDLDSLATLPVERFLVTSGFRRLQESKVRALDIADLFTEVVIDAIDEPGSAGKEPIFRDLLARRGWQADAALVVGDNPESELAAGRRLGIRTVQTLRPGVPRSDAVDMHIADLAELRRIVARESDRHA